MLSRQISNHQITINKPLVEKAGTVDFKEHPTRKVGTRSRQCRPKVPGRFAFPCARNSRICSIWRFGKSFPAIFPGLAPSFPREPLNRTRNSHSLLEFSESQGFYYGAQNDYTYNFTIGNEFANCTGHLLHRTFWHELFFVIRRLHKVLSANSPITRINCLGINFPIIHTHLLHKRIVSELFV